VASDIDQQRRVVDDQALVLAKADPLRQAQRNPALAQNVLHRLAEAEIDPEGERGHELRQADLRTRGPLPSGHPAQGNHGLDPPKGNDRRRREAHASGVSLWPGSPPEPLAWQ